MKNNSKIIFRKKNGLSIVMGILMVLGMVLGNLNTVPVQAAVSSAGIKGVNWADPRDNYSDDALIISGLSSADSYETVRAKAKLILKGFTDNLGANAVRLPINPYTVSGSWWNSYMGTIDQALENGMKVILGYWEGPSKKDGKLDNSTDFWKMWSIITDKYGKSENVYFEIMNEPFGYTQSEWGNLCQQWLKTYSSIPHGRILIGGTGYDDKVTGMGADSRFSDCLLSQHIYPYWNSSITTESGWLTELNNRIGKYSSRTVITEFGTDMTTGLNFGDATSTDHRVAFMRTITNYIHNNNMGCCVWPGLRDGDTYSVETLKGTGTDIYLINNNSSFIPLLKNAYEPASATVIKEGTYKITNKKSGKVLEVSESSTKGGSSVIQWSDNSGNNQLWKIVSAGNGYYKLLNVNSDLALDVDGASSLMGTGIIQWHYNGEDNQLWKFTKMGSGYYEIVNKSSGLVLDVDGSSTSNGARIIQWEHNVGENQLWKLTQQ